MKRLFVLIIIFLMLLFVARGWWMENLVPFNKDQQTKTIIIPKGKSLNEIAKLLQDEKIIRSAFIFSLYAKMQGLSNKLSAGTFKLSPSMSVPEIVKELSGKPSEAWVTLIEGWRVEEMAEKLGLEFLEIAKEGYMFPDTYLFPNEYTPEQIAKAMRDNFDKKYSADLRAKIKALGLTEEEGVILASIVEREARSDKVRTEVASILLKRLKIDMGLNADATIQYALGYQKEEKSWWKRHLTKEDLKMDSSYNTYLYRGLPPTPISNPGLSSLEAVANGDPNTPYLYYYHDSKGRSHYAKTLEEHNQNVANNP